VTNVRNVFPPSRQYIVMTRSRDALTGPCGRTVRPSRGAGAALLLAWLLAGPAAWAGDTATVYGTVLDASGAVVADATVTARNVATGVARSALTSPDGSYRIPALAPGPYEISAARSGFAPARRTGVRLGLGADVRIDLPLAMPSFETAVTVERDGPLVTTTDATVQTVVNREQLELMPLIERDYVGLLRLVPGVAEPLAAGGRIAGSRDFSNAFLIDGVDNSEDLVGLYRQTTNLDAVQEFQVLLNNFKAEYGRASGGVVQVLTRSGTNQFHGSAFFMYRDESMAARDYFAPEDGPKDPFERRQWGGSLGGPIVRDRAHFFLSFEKAELDTFEATTRPYPAPGAAIGPATMAFLQQHGVPPFPDTSGDTLVRLARPEHGDTPVLSARVDYAVSPAHTLRLSTNWVRRRNPSGRSGTIFDADGAVASNRTVYAALAHKWTLSANRLNELYLQVGQTRADSRVSFPTLPAIFVDEYSAGTPYLGATPLLPQGRTDRVFQLVDNYTWYLADSWAGRHVLKLGGDLKLFRSDSLFDLNFRGSFFFRTVDDFLAGLPRRFTQAQGDSRLDRPNNLYAVYLQDDWTPSRKLTLNLGLRYDYESAPQEVLKDVTGNPACGRLITCGEPGPGIGGDTNNFSPRLGATWDPWGDGKTAVHGGLGVYYDQVTLNVQGFARFTPPKVFDVQIEDPSFPDPFLGGTPVGLRPNMAVMDEDMVTPRNLNTSLGVRREIRKDLAVDVTLVYNRGEDQVLTINVNPIDPATGLRPDPDFTNINLLTNAGKIRYEALLVEVEKRLANRYSFGLAYTLSKTLNNSEQIGSSIQDPRRIELSYGRGDADRRHRLAANAIARLPWDLDLAGIFELQSEVPLNVIAGGRDLNGDGITGDWPPGYSRNSVGELSTEEANRLRGLFGRPAIDAFADNPRYWNLDLTVQKAIRLGGSRRLKLTLQALNLLNHPNFRPPVASVTSLLFGRIVALYGDPRQLQLGGQVEF